jgi:putative transposase
VDFTRRGEPVENAQLESFNDRLRDEGLISKGLISLDDARKKVQDRHCDCNEARPHSSLGDLPPALAAQIKGVAPALPSRDQEEKRHTGRDRGSGSSGSESP